jgi:hypothetical protein
MNHQPFEDWMLGEDKLTREQQKALQDHLLVCPTCTSLNQSWQGVQKVILTSPQVAPLPGFSNRWKEHLAQKRAIQQRHTAWWIFGGCLGLVLAILFILYAPQLTQFSPGEILANILFQFTVIFVKTRQTQELVEILLHNVPPVIPMIVCFLAASSLTILSVTWVVAIWKIIVPKGERI